MKGQMITTRTVIHAILNFILSITYITPFSHSVTKMYSSLEFTYKNQELLSNIVNQNKQLEYLGQ